MSFYQTLITATAPERQQLLQLPVVTETMVGDVTLPRYLRFLSQAYHHVKHTVPLLMACGSRLAPQHLWLQKAIAEYIEEELGHEQWILNDIKAAGGDAEAVAASSGDLTTEVMVAYAYDLISRRNPLGFFGMVHVLEGTSIALATSAAATIQQHLHLPNNAFSYLRSHGDLDIEHVQFFQTLMDQIIDSDDQQVIINSAKHFYPLYGNVLSAAY